MDTLFSSFIYLSVAVVVLILLLDIIPLFNTWQSRIHIGRFQDPGLWQKKVLTVAVDWLENTPTIKLTDNSRLIIIDILRGNYRKSAIQSWQEAPLFLGLTRYLQAMPSAEIQKKLESFVASKTTLAGGWRRQPTDADHAMLAYAFISSEFVNHKKYKPAFDETYRMILSVKGSDGTVAYKSHNRDYRFVDTIGFICPFLVTYGLKFNVTEAVDLAIKQITEFEKYSMMPEENIPCHTYLTEAKIPAGLYGWGRGLGWFALGLIDTWHSLPADHPQKSTLQATVIKTARSAIRFQRENGGYNWLLFVKESRLDSSTTAALCWFFTLASQIPEIKDECHAARNAGLAYLQTVTRRSGAIDFSQGDTKGIGVYSQNFDILPFTQGLVLRTLIFKPQP